MDFSFHAFNTMASIGAERALHHLIGTLSAPPVIVGIGSDLAIGDSLGPIVGTMLTHKLARGSAFLYGTLRAPVTAKEIKYLDRFLTQTHPHSKIIAIDAAVGDESEIGLIKLSNTALKPGAGANKCLNKVGDCSILGIVAEKTNFSISKLNLTRLNTIYMMAEAISDALCAFLKVRAAFFAAE